ncbi:hypothetical protein NX862_01860 [Rhodobacter sp. KR11]|jgi:hypothetical protein|uniref:hypothetical protein n=1 Tax=Rhodobacter sp. KR11 TaxID=2974588 RepID=UPI002221E5C1|nr:hypothetical protein [Rhodobacter sp. KR11]MCW1917490.1 hypothetical protein [Rhodobacter sp. KR11]
MEVAVPQGFDALTPVQQAFLTKHLGVKAKSTMVVKALPVWMAAREVADQDIDALQKALRGHKAPIFAKIADAGLHGITSGELTRMQAALMDLDRAAPADRPKAAARTRAAMTQMRGFLDGNPGLALLERNPFGLTIGLRQTLGRALAQIETALAGEA